MNCERYRTLMAEELVGAIPPADSADLAAHLGACEACRAEAALVRRTWVRMGNVPDPEPPPFMATRFQAALEAYETGLRERHRGFWGRLPQAAVALGCVAAGVFAGTMWSGRTQPEVAEMRQELRAMRQIVTLSLLQQDSAAERLQGVSWSYQANPNDAEVLGALLQTVNSDASVDVRLAAVEALRTLRASPVARRGLVQSLAKQTSPLVQIAIVDALLEMRERSAAGPMRTLMRAPGIDPSVRERIETALPVMQ